MRSMKISFEKEINIMKKGINFKHEKLFILKILV